MRLNKYAIVERAVEEGIAYGYRRAIKHTQTPSHEAIKEEIHKAVISSLYRVLDLDASDNFWGDQLAEVLLDAKCPLAIGRAAYRAHLTEGAVLACITDEPDRFVKLGETVALVLK